MSCAVVRFSLWCTIALTSMKCRWSWVLASPARWIVVAMRSMPRKLISTFEAVLSLCSIIAWASVFIEIVLPGL